MHGFQSKRSEHLNYPSTTKDSYWKYAKKQEKSAIVTCKDSVNETYGEFEGLMWGPMSYLKMHKVDDLMCGYDYIGEEYNPIGRDIQSTGDPFDMKAKEAVNFPRLERIHPSYVELVDTESRKARERKFGVINKLDP